MGIWMETAFTDLSSNERWQRIVCRLKKHFWVSGVNQCCFQI